MEANPALPTDAGQFDIKEIDIKGDRLDAEASIAQDQVASLLENDQGAAVPAIQDAQATDAVEVPSEQLVPLPMPLAPEPIVQQTQPPKTLQAAHLDTRVSSAPAVATDGGIPHAASPAPILVQIATLIEVAEIPPPGPSIIEEIPSGHLPVPVQEAPPPKMRKQNAPEEPVVAKRPVRQSKLQHRNFDLEIDSEECEEYEPKRVARKKVVRERPVSQGQREGSYGYQSAMEHTRSGGAPLKYKTAMPMLPGTPRSTDFSIIDLPCPRRMRSKMVTRPRTSRASINRLKQAAHGNLPLSIDPTAALLGPPSPDRPRGTNSDAELSGELNSDSEGGGGGGGGGGRRRLSKRRRQAERQAAQDSWGAREQEKAAGGPNAIQRQLMNQIATAPPHMRQAMLQQLMKQQLGAPAMAPAPTASLASLPRYEQQAVVQQLMGRMSPQQRHSLLQMSTQQQAAFLQQYYQEHVLPQRRLAVPVAAPIHPPAPPLQQLYQQSQQQQQQPSGDNQQHLRTILSKLNPQQHAQLMAMPKEQQQELIMRLLQQGPSPPPMRRMPSSLPIQQQPNLAGLGGGNGSGGGGDGASFLLPPPPHSEPVGAAVQLGDDAWGTAPIPSAINDDLPLLGQPPAPLGGMLKDSGELFPGEVGLGALLANGPRGDDLQDAMNFFLS